GRPPRLQQAEDCGTCSGGLSRNSVPVTMSKSLRPLAEYSVLIGGLGSQEQTVRQGDTQRLRKLRYSDRWRSAAARWRSPTAPATPSTRSSAAGPARPSPRQ